MSFAFFLIRPAGKWVGRLGKSPFPPVAAKNLHRETANLFAAIRRANISDRRLDSNAADQEDLEDRASYPRITGAQLYGMCCGRLPANFDSDCARFLIDAKDFHSAHNRLKARSSDWKPRLRVSYDPQFSTTEVRQHPTPLHDSVGNRTRDAFVKPTDLANVGYLDLKNGVEVEFDDGREKSVRTPDLLFTHVPPQSWEQDPQDIAVLEIGLSQSYKDLRRCVDLWLRGSSTIKIVFLAKLTESPRYPWKANIEHIQECGLQNFPTTISVRDVKSDPNDPAGCLSIHGMRMMGKLTGFMELWLRDKESGKPAQKAERIDFYGGKSSPPDTVFKFREFVPMADPSDEVVLRWDVIRLAIEGAKKHTACKRYREVLDMARTGKDVPRGRTQSVLQQSRMLPLNHGVVL